MSSSAVEHREHFQLWLMSQFALTVHHTDGQVNDFSINLVGFYQMQPAVLVGGRAYRWGSNSCFFIRCLDKVGWGTAGNSKHVLIKLQVKRSDVAVWTLHLVVCVSGPEKQHQNVCSNTVFLRHPTSRGSTNWPLWEAYVGAAWCYGAEVGVHEI